MADAAPKAPKAAKAAKPRAAPTHPSYVEMVTAGALISPAAGARSAPALCAPCPAPAPGRPMTNNAPPRRPRAAIKALKERTGSSLPAIKKYIGANYKLPAGWVRARGRG